LLVGAITFLAWIGIFHMRAWHLTKAGLGSIRVGFFKRYSSHPDQFLNLGAWCPWWFGATFGSFRNNVGLSFANFSWTAVGVAWQAIRQMF